MNVYIFVMKCVYFIYKIMTLVFVISSFEGGIKVVKQNVNILETNHFIELQQKLEKVEESQTCAICMENKWNVAFRCGHSACSKCAESLRVCHMCRKTISDKINLFT